MARRNNFSTILAMAAGAATAATVIEYQRQKRVAMARLGQGTRIVETDMGAAQVAEIGDGPAVLFVHGALAGYEQGILIGKPLAEAGYRVISPSRPGYLSSPVIENMSFASQSDWMIALLDELKIEKAIVFGFSSGGPTAIQMALRYPDRVQALMLFCAISKQAFVDPEAETSATWMFGNLMHNDFLTWLGLQAVAKSLPLMAMSEPNGWRARVMSSPTRRAQYEKLLWSLFPSSVRLAGAISDKTKIEKLRELPLKDISVPTLIVHGTEDELVPFDHAENSAKKIPGARFLPLPGGDHGCTVSYDDIVWPETLAFLQRPSTASRPAKKTAAGKTAARKPAAKKPAAAKPAAKKSTAKPAARRSTPAEG